MSAAVDPAVAGAIARAVARYDPRLILVGLASSPVMAQAAAGAGLPYAPEAFADRAYNPDGSLQARRIPGSLISDPQQAARQAVNIAQGFVIAHVGARVAIAAQTLCLHGDNPSAVANAQAVREALTAAGVAVGRLEK